jgi:hypothetical protein
MVSIAEHRKELPADRRHGRRGQHSIVPIGRSASDTDEILTPPEAARFLKVSLSWLAKARLSGTGPVYRKAGRSVRYLRSDLERYLAASVRTSTSQI